LLGFSALHEQVRRRRALAQRTQPFDSSLVGHEFEPSEHFVLDEVLQLVAERAVTITGADGVAIALAENREIVLRASAGAVKPDVGARIDRESAFSGACFRMAQVVRCDDTEIDPRVNLRSCRKLGARSIVAVPLCGRTRVIGLLEAFSSEPFGFNDSDVSNLTLLAELILAALKPEDEERFAASAQVAVAELRSIPIPPPAPTVAPSVPSPAVKIPATKEMPQTAITPESPTQAELRGIAVTSLPLADLFERPEPAAEAALEPKPAVEAESAIEDLQPSRHGPGLVVALLLVVVASLIAGGAWWKLKNAQLDKAMIQGEVESAKIGAHSNSSPDAGSGHSGKDSAADPLSVAENQGAPATPQDLLKFPLVTGIRHWSSTDSSSVVLDLEDQVQYEAHRLSGPDRIYFDLRDTVLAADLAGKSIDVGDSLLNRIRVAQPVAGMTRVVLETKGNSNFSVSLEPNPYRLVVEVRKIGAEQKTAVNLFPKTSDVEKKLLTISVPPPTKEDLQLRLKVPKMRIVVDPGHGGWDLGTVGKRGLLEKDLCLEIAERLGKLLESRLGAEIIYTRQDDNYIALDDRASIANQAQADLFVSVHANYSDLPSARGVETYYTNVFSAPGTKDAESHAKAGDSKNPAVPTLTAAELKDKVEQSRHLAASVQRSLYGTLATQAPGLRDRGVKEAGFVVLTETSMPGILAEVSFVSSPTDEQKLRSDGYREQIAEALYKGIARYAAASKSVKVASAGK
jgi:N-acetylmuramoyl-L-alanine amidase/putative methionine-R-sulfoxide reductase with GAF domain